MFNIINSIRIGLFQILIITFTLLGVNAGIDIVIGRASTLSPFIFFCSIFCIIIGVGEIDDN